MNEKFQKIIGWVLLFAGVGIIFWGLYSSYNIFNNKSQAPEIFKIEEKKETSQKKVQGLQALAEEKVKELVGEQFKEIFPPGFLPKIFNLISWSIFAGILIFGGSQLSHLGIKMIKED